MRKLLRFIGLVAGLAGVAWMVKDKLVPAPQTPVSHPPAFRSSSPPAQLDRPPADRPDSAPSGRGTTGPPSSVPEQPSPPATGGDDLTSIKGIGPVYAGRLNGLGITTFAALAAADAAELAEQLDVAESQTTDWIEQAGALG